MTQEQDLAFYLIKPHTAGLGPSIQPIICNTDKHLQARGLNKQQRLAHPLSWPKSCGVHKVFIFRGFRGAPGAKGRTRRYLKAPGYICQLPLGAAAAFIPAAFPPFYPYFPTAKEPCGSAAPRWKLYGRAAGGTGRHRASGPPRLPGTPPCPRHSDSPSPRAGGRRPSSPPSSHPACTRPEAPPNAPVPRATHGRRSPPRAHLPRPRRARRPSALCRRPPAWQRGAGARSPPARSPAEPPAPPRPPRPEARLPAARPASAVALLPQPPGRAAPTPARPHPLGLFPPPRCTTPVTKGWSPPRGGRPQPAGDTGAAAAPLAARSSPPPPPGLPALRGVTVPGATPPAEMPPPPHPATFGPSQKPARKRSKAPCRSLTLLGRERKS
ncbi:basic proline-rich protein-like [Melospiza melodia melodia]|uniref:basic proline-rich protein-like n=1 Tax=Melospiza melodia melodia TaxID=1914991 RepID=UPI002FD407DC